MKKSGSNQIRIHKLVQKESNVAYYSESQEGIMLG